MMPLSVETHHPRISGLSQEQVRAIRHAALRILSEIGIVIKSSRGRELLLGAGARVQTANSFGILFL